MQKRLNREFYDVGTTWDIICMSDTAVCMVIFLSVAAIM